jgi:hypothetical protein
MTKSYSGWSHNVNGSHGLERPIFSRLAGLAGQGKEQRDTLCYTSYIGKPADNLFT